MAIIRRWAITWDGVNPDPGTYEAAYLTLNAWFAARPDPVNLVTDDEQWIVETFPGFEANGLDILTGILDMFYSDWTGDKATGNDIIIRSVSGYTYPQNTRDARLGSAAFSGTQMIRFPASMPFDITDLHLQTPLALYTFNGGAFDKVTTKRCLIETLGSLVGIQFGYYKDCILKTQSGSIYDYNQLVMDRCAIYDSGASARLITDSIVTNCAVYRTGTGPCFALGGNSGTNNASSDGTALSEGVGTIINFTMSEFVQPDGSDMHIVPGSQFEGAGANQWDGSGTQADIDRDLYPQTGDWNIGADYIPGGVPTPQTNSLFLGQDF